MVNTEVYLEKIKAFSAKWINAKTSKVYAWIVFVILFLILASNSAKLFWTFFDDYRGNAGGSQQSAPKQSQEHSYLGDILDSKMFPIIPEKIAQLHKTATQVAAGKGAGSGTGSMAANKSSTPSGPAKLPLVITGILASDHRNKSQVIIKYRNEEVLYGEGDAIEGTAARVSHIMDNRVEVFNSGRIDVYFLDEENKVSPPPPVRTTPNTTANNAPKKPGNGANNKNQNPGKSGVPNGFATKPGSSSNDLSSKDFMDYVSISPIREGNVVKGYRLNPGAKPELFAKSGFKENDIATAVNGYDLTNPEQARKLFSEYKDIENFEITVIRDGVSENIYLNLGDISGSK